MNKQVSFLIEKQEYEKSLAPVYRHFKLSGDIFQIAIILPFYMSFDPIFSIESESERCICTFCFSDHAYTDITDTGDLDGEPFTQELKKTRVEMICMSDQEIAFDQDEITFYFEVLLKELNKFLVSYLINIRDIDVCRISKEMLQPAALFRIIGSNPWSVKREGLFIIHTDVSYGREELHTGDPKKIVYFANVFNQKWNPFMASEEIALNSKRLFKEGYYREAIILAQTSVETLLKELLYSFLIEEGKSVTETDAYCERLAFIPMIRKEFHPRLGGNWNLEDGTTLIGQWYSKTYKLRNQIVHGGLYPDYQQAIDALTASQGFRKQVILWLTSKGKIYPKTNSLVHTNE